jgi:hypothetical protein
MAGHLISVMSSYAYSHYGESGAGGNAVLVTLWAAGEDRVDRWRL